MDDQESKLNDIWKYFEQEGSRKARCVVCHEGISNRGYEYLKAHLFENHPKLMLQLGQEKDDTQETKSDPGTDAEDNDNNYTEIVYLEQDSALEDPQPVEKPTKSNSFSRSSAKRCSTNTSSDHCYKIPKNDVPQEEETELDSFIKYIRCLLKKLPPDTFSKLQVDILKLIMDAQYSNKVTVTDNRSTTNILTEIISNVGNVIRVSDIQDNNSLIGNYTVTLASQSDDTVRK